MQPQKRMTEASIQKKVTARFDRNLYHLTNAYIFARDWESDYFSMTKTGYCYEVEIKLSRSDFFSDFKKHKHFLLSDPSRELHIKKYPNDGRGDKIGMETVQSKKWPYTSYQKATFAPASRIAVSKVAKVMLPNRFYYCVPEGLIAAEEVPAYAGLMYVSDQPWQNLIEVKRAPLIHKEKLDLNKVLLEKFYWRYQNLLNKQK